VGTADKRSRKVYGSGWERLWPAMPWKRKEIAIPAFAQSAAPGADLLSVVTSVSNLVVALAALALSALAVRFSQEQARQYLFPVPALYVDEAQRSVVLRNFGSGAMLDIYADITVHTLPSDATAVWRYCPSLGPQESLTLIPRDMVTGTAVVALSVDVRYADIRRRPKRADYKLSSTQLGALDGM